MIAAANPFSGMVSDLTTTRTPHRARSDGMLPREPVAFDRALPAGSKVSRMRALLRDAGRQRADALAAAGGVTTALVMPLLKNDIHAGRVRVETTSTGNIYEWAGRAMPADDE